ncbi:hypothetical protein KFK09_013999 [Dendrobium nobile]|uniref:Reverse transcriptase zinc-binding domain-containing protein n=1 Tax=Dendrobium nobile TaxID=94219 RepID=A0A8T3BAS1_DENNO|nr:hypothetical protein KFK09_013999 [Dendrobium nobile]
MLLFGKTIGWARPGSIDNYLNTHTIITTKVSEFVYNGDWNIPKLHEVVPLDIIDKIIQIPLQLYTKDKIMFKLTPSSNFILNNIWEETRFKNAVSSTFRGLWHNAIPVSYSLFAWRCLKGFVPIDNILWNKGFMIVSKCQCCLNIESLHHVFMNGPIASKVWSYFFNLVGIDFFNANLDLNGIFKYWFNDDKGNIHNILPIVIIWYLWSSRNDAKHMGLKMNAYDIIYKVRFKILQLKAVNLISIKHFTNSISLAAHFGIQNETFKIHRELLVYWTKPYDPFVKLNIDGSVHHSKAGMGGLIRNAHGNACADWLANFGAGSEILLEHPLSQIPVPLKGLIMLDKSGLPYIRHKSGSYLDSLIVCRTGALYSFCAGAAIENELEVNWVYNCCKGYMLNGGLWTSCGKFWISGGIPFRLEVTVGYYYMINEEWVQFEFNLRNLHGTQGTLRFSFGFLYFWLSVFLQEA